MNSNASKNVQLIFETIVIITLFSIWAGFALIFVNPFLAEYFPNYIVGQICIWEFVALILAIFINWRMKKRWGKLHSTSKGFVLPKPYGLYFTGYIILALIAGVWQYYLFTLSF